MKLLKINFKVADSGFKEVLQKGLSHRAQVEFLAMGKAKFAAKKYPTAIIIAADTMVSFKNKIIGKPINSKNFYDMLKSFSGKPQEVLTGVAILDAANGKSFVAVKKSRVYFKNLNKLQIQNHIASGDGWDKAGGYGVMGKGLALIQKIEGSHTASLGLPLEFVINALIKLKVYV